MHKNIIPVFETFEYNFSLWIVQELMICSVKELLNDMVEPISEKFIAFILKEVCTGLSVMHNHGRIHRDIKSDNVLVSRKGEVKLADMGCAAQLVQEQNYRNTVIGTPYYMAPELALGKQYNEKVDIWGVGILGYYLAQKETPYHGLPLNEVLTMIVSETSPKLKQEEKFSQEFKDFIKVCLNKNPDERPDVDSLLFHQLFEKLGTGVNGEFLAYLEKINTEDDE
jgi:p21-activated kinase 1